MAAGSGELVLELRDVAKSFGPVVALRSGRIAARRRVHPRAGRGERRRQVDAGQDRRRRAPPRRRRVPARRRGASTSTRTAESKAAGVAVIYQEPTLFPDLSVTENIFMGRQPLGRGRRIDRGAMHAEAEALFARLGVHIDPRRPALGLSIADQQIIEIAKAISLDARLLIMDEPTAALSGVEVDRLFAVARSLRDEGRALIFISHRFDEVFDLCDTVTVMRDGAYVDTVAIAETSVDAIVADDGRPRGRRPVPQDPGRDRRAGARGRGPQLDRRLPRRQLRGPRRRDRRPGRPGRRRPQRDRPRRLRRRLLRLRHRDAWPARAVPKHNPRAAIRRGMAFVPEDRRKQGLVTEASVARNIAGVIRGGLGTVGLLTAAPTRARPPAPGPPGSR